METIDRIESLPETKEAGKTTAVWLRLHPDLAAKIQRAAKADRRSVNAWCSIQLEKVINRRYKGVVKPIE
jgi:hypothetical protein